jgi:protein-disulfide isomerase
VDEGIRLGVTVIPAFFMYDQLIVGSSSLSHFMIVVNLSSAFLNFLTK